MKINCNIIRDILPLYTDDIVSDDTKELVESHLRECRSCTEEAESMKKPLTLPPETETKTIRSIKRLWNRKIAKIAVITSAVALLLSGLVSGYLILLCNRPFVCAFPVESDEVEVTTGIEYSENGYLNQRFFIYFCRPDGKSLEVSLDDEVVTDESGNAVTVGYIIELREVPVDIFRDPYDFHDRALGYTYAKDMPPETNFDFRITVKYKDKTEVYSMAEEGLFIKQETLDVCPDWTDPDVTAYPEEIPQ